MKTKLIITILFLSLTLVTSAQPLPPTTPNGNPVPVESLLVLLPAALMALGIVRLRSKRKQD